MCAHGSTNRKAHSVTWTSMGMTMRHVKGCNIQRCRSCLQMPPPPLWSVVCTCGVHGLLWEAVRGCVRCDCTHQWACVQIVDLQVPQSCSTSSCWLAVYTERPRLPSLAWSHATALAEQPCAHPISAGPPQWCHRCGLSRYLPFSASPAW